MSWSLSLLDPQGKDPIGLALAWIIQVLVGQLVISLCVIAVALLGILMLGGRLPILAGARVMLGCFILLGTPVVATEFLALWQVNDEVVPTSFSTEVILNPREELPPATFDPYAGASLRRRGQE